MRRLSISGALLGLLLAAGPGRAVNINILNADGAGEGFNDPKPVAPVTGNAGTTLGQQRLNVFMAAAAYWSNRLASPVAITVQARMDPLTCSTTSAILGSAGAADFFAQFPNAPRSNTWYPSALANHIAGSDLDPATPEIVAQFNSRLGTDSTCLPGFNWYYGIGGTAPSNTQSFYQTVVHELAHGLGFLTIVDLSTGATAQGLDDGFMLYLEDHGTGKTWTQMSNSERRASALNTGALHWTGPSVVAASGILSAGRHPSGHVQMYSPSPLRLGSSVSHFDTALKPDEVMEPFAVSGAAEILTTQLLHDVGWPLQSATPSGPCVRDASTACLQSGRFEVKVDWRTSTASGAAQVMGFGGQRTENDDSVFWWFFSPTNFELGVKTLNACGVNGKLWVFLSGLTDQGWTVNVRDTATGAIKTYSNAIGSLSQTTADTAAFSCP